jgi:hypothetical protein
LREKETSAEIVYFLKNEARKHLDPSILDPRQNLNESGFVPIMRWSRNTSGEVGTSMNYGKMFWADRL